ncbi:alpha/beta hydrolase [Nocardiopsis ganjiahuensis]|uniref:alpha/beta hydrolase n=1 Tax=Nocardiopsis ganjiahuensis TaxID=239984 RepID=UPI0004755983|nr:alpha/beta hydrolase [Nocardiopsis ganjiahuensis]
MDPELEAFLPFVPQGDLSDPLASRRAYAEVASARPLPDLSDLEVEDRTVPAASDTAASTAPGVPVRLYRPRRTRGALVWMHGGGWAMGDVDTEHPWAARIALDADLVVISVGYRLAPEAPFPAAMDDVYTVLNWAAENAAELGIDPDRIAVGGHSAGANLAAAVSLRARDEQGPPIRFQLLNEPSLDDRQESWSARNFTDTPWATRKLLTQAWQLYLGAVPATVYAAPARATDLSGLPPAYIATAEFDPSRDEQIDYALRLLQAGVSVELHQWPGTFHGSQAVLSAEVSQRQVAELTGALRRAMAA